MNDTPEKTIPAGYRQDSKGRLVPENLIEPLKLLEDELAGEGLAKARDLVKGQEALREWALERVLHFISLARQEYGVKRGGKNNELTVRRYDGSGKWEVDSNDFLALDSVEMTLAMELIDKCRENWTEGAKAEAVALIDKMLQPGKNGQLSVSKIMQLFQLPFTDEDWVKAMDLVKKAIRVSQTRLYVRFYERTADGGKSDKLVLAI